MSVGNDAGGFEIRTGQRFKLGYTHVRQFSPGEFQMFIRWMVVSVAIMLTTACATTAISDRAAVNRGQAIWAQVQPQDLTQGVPAIEASLGQLFDLPLSSETCSRHRAALEHYLARVPIDVTYRQAAIDCAVLLNDPVWQRESQDSLDALIAFAFRDGHGLQAWQPAPALHAWEIPAIAEYRGLSLNWMRYLSFNSIRYLLVEASMVDAQGRERRYYFDLLEAMLRLGADDPALAYPSARRSVIFNQLEAEAIAGDPLALTGSLYLDLESGELNPVAARRALMRSWESGFTGGGISLVEYCLSSPEANCDPDQLHAVCDELAELGIAEGYALRSALHLVYGQKSLDDPDVHNALMSAGDLSSLNRMQFYLAAVLNARRDLHSEALQRSIDELFSRAADRGNGKAALVLASQAIAQNSDDITRETLAYLDQAVFAGIPVALHLKALMSGLATERGIDFTRRAAERGHADSQFILGVLAEVIADDNIPGFSKDWMKLAAEGGNVAAMRRMALREIQDGKTKGDLDVALNWLFSAYVFDDLDAGAWIVALHAMHPELETEFEQSAVEIAIGFNADIGPESIRLIDQAFAELDPDDSHADDAFVLFKALAASSIPEAALVVAERLRYGQGTAVDLELAEDWYEKSIALGSLDARYLLARLQFFELDELGPALDQFALAAEQGHVWASNDLAWMLCVGVNGIDRDPERGLALIESLLESLRGRLETPHPYHLSSLAACQAATGDFESAIASNEQALTRNKVEQPDDAFANDGMRERLRLYQSGQPYIWTEQGAP